jgi:phosphosulfolactate synthase (CoM biosynthesis protein A)
MITYESNPSMKQFIDRIKEAGEIVRSAKHEVLGISEKSLMTTEEAARHIETMVQWGFAGLSEKLSKRTSNEACDMIVSVVQLALNHPELINDIDYAIRGAMKRW